MYLLPVYYCSWELRFQTSSTIYCVVTKQVHLSATGYHSLPKYGTQESLQRMMRALRSATEVSVG